MRGLSSTERTKPEMIAAAVDLARDASLLPAKVCQDRKLPPGSHTRAKALRERILAAGLLTLCTLDAKEVSSPPVSAAGLFENLLVQTRWISESTPRMSSVSKPALAISVPMANTRHGRSSSSLLAWMSRSVQVCSCQLEPCCCLSLYRHMLTIFGIA